MAPADGKQTTDNEVSNCQHLSGSILERCGCKGMTDCKAIWRDIAESIQETSSPTVTRSLILLESVNGERIPHRIGLVCW